MIGFMVGIACLVGLARMARRRRGWRDGWRRHDGTAFWLRRLFERLDTTPGQEKEIRHAVEDFRDEAREAKEELWKTREDLGKALEGSYFDETVMGETFARHDDAITKMRKASVGLLGRVHEALDGEQRKVLGRYLRRHRGFGHPYRSFG